MLAALDPFLVRYDSWRETCCGIKVSAAAEALFGEQELYAYLVHLALHVPYLDKFVIGMTLKIEEFRRCLDIKDKAFILNEARQIFRHSGEFGLADNCKKALQMAAFPTMDEKLKKGDLANA